MTLDPIEKYALELMCDPNRVSYPVHICEEFPCPVQDREIAEMLKAGFETVYVEGDTTTE